MKIGVKYAFADKLIGKLFNHLRTIHFLLCSSRLSCRTSCSASIRWYLLVSYRSGSSRVRRYDGRRSYYEYMGEVLSTEEKLWQLDFFAFGSFAIGMGFSKNFIFYLGLMVCYGVALTMVQTAITTMLQEKRTPLCRGVYLDYLARCMLAFTDWYGYVWPFGWYSSLAVIMIGSGIALIVIAGIAYYSRELKTI